MALVVRLREAREDGFERGVGIVGNSAEGGGDAQRLALGDAGVGGVGLAAPPPEKLDNVRLNAEGGEIRRPADAQRASGEALRVGVEGRAGHVPHADGEVPVRERTPRGIAEKRRSGRSAGRRRICDEHPRQGGVRVARATVARREKNGHATHVAALFEGGEPEHSVVVLKLQMAPAERDKLARPGERLSATP